MKRKSESYYMSVPQVKYGLSEQEVHDFVDKFTTRYAGLLNEGRDLRFVYDFELSCLETGMRHFYLGQTYANPDGYTMVVVDRREDMLVIEVDGEYFGVDYWHEDGLEWCVLEDTRWSADDIQPNED